MQTAPIALFVYNRPDHTRKTLEALRQNEYASESILYVFADGPQKDADEDTINKINAVRTYIRSINGFKDVKIKEQEYNIGLDTSIINGVTEILNKHGQCITVEDDIVTHPWFLRFINECLIKYKNDKRICMIGGYNVRMKFPWWYKKDIYLAHRCCSWGWGIWKDRWDDVDWTIQGYNAFLQDEKLKKKFCRGGDDMLPMLIEQMKQEVPAWDIRWDYTLMKKNGYVIRPVKTLVINCGLDGTGVHCGIQNSTEVAADLPQTSVYKMHLPNKIKACSIIQKRFKCFFTPSPTFSERFFIPIRHHLYSIYRRIKKMLTRSCFQPNIHSSHRLEGNEPQNIK